MFEIGQNMVDAGIK